MSECCLSRSFSRFALDLGIMGFVFKLCCWCFKVMRLLMLQLFRIWFLLLTRAIDIQQLHIIVHILTTTTIFVQG